MPIKLLHESEGHIITVRRIRLKIQSDVVLGYVEHIHYVQRSYVA